MSGEADQQPIVEEAARDPEPELLVAPRSPMPPLVDSAEALGDAVERLAGGHGPVAVDTERAGGHRYSQRAYLVQAFRRGSGIVLIDPIACPDLSEVSAVLADEEWVLHAASQDLPALRGVGMSPDRLFDTELAGRLLNRPRVGLGTLVEEYLGYGLEKAHSAADWSRRPLPEEWLRYAALDVDLLVDLRDLIDADLRAAGKRDWAEQEFTATLHAPAPAPRVDPWRRTSGMHRVRSPRAMAVVRELWTERDRLAADRDLTPTRVLRDTAIVEAALAMPGSQEEMAALPSFKGRRPRGSIGRWYGAIARAAALPKESLPPPAARYDGPPPARSWADRDPAAAARLTAARAGLATVAEACDVPVENLLLPETLRRIMWQPPEPADEPDVRAAMTALGARAWQVEKCAGALANAIAASEAALEPIAPEAGAGDGSEGTPGK